MKINIGDIYREQNAKYYFASNYISGKILDITFGKYMDFSKSHFLLSKGATEVWSIDLLNNDQFLTIRKLEKNGICFQKRDMKELEHAKFDSIISFNAFSATSNIDRLLEIIKKCLSDKGVVMISILNNEFFSDNTNLNSLGIKFTVNDLKRCLNQFFMDVTLFTQGNIIQIESLQKRFSTKGKSEHSLKFFIKIKLKKFFTMNEKRRIFYLNYLQPKYRYIKNIRRKRKYKIDTKKYDVIPYVENSNPISIVALCKR